MDLQRVLLEYLYFNYIDKKRELKDLRSGGTHHLDDPDVKEVYGGYFVEIAKKRASRKCYDMMEIKSKRCTDMKKALHVLRTTVVPDEEEKFKNIGKGLAKELTENMHGYHPGVLFVGRFVVGGDRYIGLLKLEWVDESYSEYDEEDEEFVIKRLAQELPAAGRLQKAAIFPHPKYSKQFLMKVFQKDHVADYFNEFLGGQPPVRGRKMMSQIRKLALRLNGGKLSVEESVDLHAALSDYLGQKQRMVDENAVSSIIHQVLSNVGKKRVKDLVNTHLEVKGPVNANEVENLRARIDIGGIRVLGTYRSLKERFHENKPSKNKHIIEGEIDEVSQE
jgi:phage-related protein